MLHLCSWALDFRKKSSGIGAYLRESLLSFLKQICLGNNFQTLDSSLILDVGTGNGVLCSYLKKHAGGNNIRFDESAFHGVDISQKMIDTASKKFPRAIFKCSSFQDFNSSTSFSSIVFNECFHYFINHHEIIEKAVSLLTVGGRVVISHPKGLANIYLQRSKNPQLVPSLLPVDDILNEIANLFNLNILVSPSAKAAHYLAVLEKPISSM
jgi:2-polyprenyl-3-methyl-5-hydroxy-6-metoxy-1,4-benzoquinol methylase